jgi:hypothetical protein
MAEHAETTIHLPLIGQRPFGDKKNDVNLYLGLVQV